MTSLLRTGASVAFLTTLLLHPEPATGASTGASYGPASGVTETFSRTSPAEVAARARGEAAASSSLEEREIPSRPDRQNRTASAAPIGGNEVDDPGRSRGPFAPKTTPVATGFPAFSDAGMSPPDPIIAAGPDHVVVAVNSKWGIFTKSGALIFQASAVSWFGPQLSAVHAISLQPYDPQVAYDHFRGRWILLYSATDIASQSWILLSVSSSSDPTAAWYSWALPGDVNGTTPAANFSDFPALGFDDSAIYIATNQFRYSDTAFEYAKLRVLKKDALYAGASVATWSDFWDLEDPASPGSRVHSVRPAQTFGSPGVEYLVSNSPYVTRTFVTLWSVAGAGTAAPSLSAVNVPVTATREPPGANQKGGSPGTAGCPTPCLIDTGRGSITSAVYRNGSVWLSHAVADAGGVHSRARYARISVPSLTALEDEAFGSDGCWYFYPAIAVDDGNNLAMVFGRSCVDEYAGIGDDRALDRGSGARAERASEGRDGELRGADRQHGARQPLGRLLRRRPRSRRPRQGLGRRRIRRTDQPVEHVGRRDARRAHRRHVPPGRIHALLRQRPLSRDRDVAQARWHVRRRRGRADHRRLRLLLVLRRRKTSRSSRRSSTAAASTAGTGFSREA